LLGKIVPFLVEAVDVALGPVDGLEAEVVAAGDILLVPEGKVAEVVFLEQPEKALARDGRRDLVPAGGECGLVGGDFLGVEFHGCGEMELKKSRPDTSLRIL